MIGLYEARLTLMGHIVTLGVELEMLLACRTELS